MTKKRLPTIEIYEIRSGNAWNWRLIGGNGEKMARGSEPKGFSTPQGAWRNLSKVRQYLGVADFPSKMPGKGKTLVVEGLEIIRCG